MYFDQIMMFSKPAMHFQIWQLAEISMHYDQKDEKHVTKWASRLQVYMKSQLFHFRDLMEIIGILYTINMACVHGTGHEGAATWTVPFFVKKTAAAVPTKAFSLRARYSFGSVKEGLITSLVQG